MQLDSPQGDSIIAYEALGLAQAEPRRARQLAVAVLAEPALDPGTRSIAEHALGLAAKELHDLDGALIHLRAALRAARGAGRRDLVAETRMSLSYVLLACGKTGPALREARLAAGVLQGLEAARLRVREALVVQRLGRLDEALQGYRQALPVLRREGDRLWEARLLCNRGVLHVYRGEFAAAERDLARSEELYRELGQALPAVQARHNRGFAAARRGDIPAALRHYDLADEGSRALGVTDWVGMADRCDVLLSGRLVPEARALADRAVRELRDAGMAPDLAEALLLHAKVALLQGDAVTARRSAEEARRSFERQGRRQWRALARHLALSADWQEGVRSPAIVTRAMRVSRDLEASGWRPHALDALLIGARTALELGRVETARRALLSARATRRGHPFELRARAWHAEALLRIASGDGRGADAALRAGMRAVERHRATIGATELRVAVGTYANELAALGLRQAVRSGSPWRVLVWAERWRAGTLFLPPVAPPEDAALVADLAELRNVVAQVGEAAAKGHDPHRLLAHQAALERAVQRRTRHAGGVGATSPTLPSAGALRDSLEDRALVEVVDLDGDLHAVVMTRHGARLRRLGDRGAVLGELEALRFALRRMAQGRLTPAVRAAAEQALAHAAARLDALLLDPLRADVADSALVIVPTGPLHSLPWGAIPSLAGRPVTVAPSAAQWWAATAQPMSGPAVFVGCQEPPEAIPEVTALAGSYDAPVVLIGEQATAAAVREALDGAGLAHIACHAQFRSDNPLFSCLLLHDGPLTVYDLERVGKAPHLIVLSACDTGLSQVHPGDELMGLSSALFAQGAATLVASVVPVPDAETRELMLAFHAALRSGASPTTALARAQDETRTGAGFVCFGAG